MIESRVAIKYATALFRTAKKTNQVESISHDLSTLSLLLRRNVLLKNLLESPQVLEKNKKELISSIFKPLISEALFSFLMLVLNKHRIQYLISMAEEYEQLVREDQGIVEACLTTARSLDKTLAGQIRQELERTSGKRIDMQLKIDASLIGGIVIILGDKVIDRSIRHQLSQLKEQMSALRVY